MQHIQHFTAVPGCSSSPSRRDSEFGLLGDLLFVCISGAAQQTCFPVSVVSHIVSCVQAHRTSLELLRLRGMRRCSCVSTRSGEFSLLCANHEFSLRYQQQFFFFFLKAELRRKYHYFMGGDEMLPVSTLCSMYVLIYSKCAWRNQCFGQGNPVCLAVVSAVLPITNCCPALLCSLKRNTAYWAEVFMRD